MKNEIELDVQGLRCPLPLTYLRRKLKTIMVDTQLNVISDDPTTLRDIPYYCDYVEIACSIISNEKPYRFKIDVIK